MLKKFIGIRLDSPQGFWSVGAGSPGGIALMKHGWSMAPDLNETESLFSEFSSHDHGDSPLNDSTVALKMTAAGSELLVAKIVAMIVLGFCSFCLGILPVKLAKWLKWNKEPTSTAKSSPQPFVISLLLCFGGGVLLYTTFMHLQPEVREGIQELQNTGELPEFRHGLHFAELIFCVGFFFVYLVEELVHAVLDRRPHEHEDEAVLHRTMSLRRCLLNSSLSTILVLDNEDDGSSASGSTVAKSLRGLLAVLALSFHAVFEGLAVGLEKSVGNVWYLFAAIATHKLVIGFCVGVELISTRTRLVLIFVYMATFAVVTPIGIGVGIALSNDGEEAGTNTVPTVVLQGMAAGTLLYVVFFEVLQRERANTQSGIWQLVAIIAGFAIMFALQLLCKCHCLVLASAIILKAF
ncbi:hypothetical protein B7P43_G06135 [Cryptotermes secundus]|uniref:Zinc transporter ZIP1 n=1 Tax=Cryptotermes secundus TaxID=105785 RepID=A0A2J7QPT7_9NEOP|nr:hypothetical protein B7P43_G06135 [Cryptotermes secundus]